MANFQKAVRSFSLHSKIKAAFVLNIFKKQVICSNFCDVTPIDSNFPIYSLTITLSLLDSFSYKTHPYFFESVSLRKDVCTPGVELKSLTSKLSTSPCHNKFYKNLNLSQFYKNFLHFSFVSVKEAGDNFSSTCFILFIQSTRLSVSRCPIKKQSTSHRRP